MKLSSNSTLIVVLVLALVAAGYWYFFTGKAEEPTLSNAGTSGPAQAQFETLISELQPISFNTAIFNDPRFNILVDIKTPLSLEAAGRPDPFAVLDGR